MVLDLILGAALAADRLWRSLPGRARTVVAVAVVVACLAVVGHIDATTPGSTYY